MMLKYTQAAYSEEVFRNTETRALEAAASLADLSTRRFEQIEHSESWAADLTREPDLFSWVNVADPSKVESFDRYFLRAFLAAYKSMVGAERVALTVGPDDAVAVTADGKRDLTTGQRDDLLVIAYWGDCEISFQPSGLQIRARKTHAT